MKSNRILVTGGTGYIGSHTVVKLLDLGFDVTVLDNLANSNQAVLNIIHEITGKDVDFIQGDILDKNLLKSLFSNSHFDAVIHFAGLKAVGESETEPLKYYENNVTGSTYLISEMMNAEVKNLIFSSSATVYGDPGYAKCAESTPLAPISVYGKTKYFVEEIIRDVAKSDQDFRFGILRYFNPVGAHISGLIGEDPNGIPNNLLPFVSQVAVGKREKVMVWGNDYPTSDGTGRRDYIHVDDLASGHIAALESLRSGRDSFTVNLGTGNSYSVLEVIDAFSKASGKEIKYEFAERRPGDVAENFSDPSLAKSLLGWSAKHDLAKMCEDAWRWQSQNPDGFERT